MVSAWWKWLHIKRSYWLREGLASTLVLVSQCAAHTWGRQFMYFLSSLRRIFPTFFAVLVLILCVLLFCYYWVIRKVQNVLNWRATQFPHPCTASLTFPFPRACLTLITSCYSCVFIICKASKCVNKSTVMPSERCVM